MPSLLGGLFKNIAKYLKKDIVYTLDFNAENLVKLEPGFNAEVSIYDENGINITINSENPTGIIKGSKFKIKSNDDAMVYFYGKLSYYKQIKLEPEKGKNIEIKMKKYIQFLIDFGFEGYNPTDVLNINSKYFEKDGIIYLENIYDKLKTKLVKGEFLYLYHDYTYGDSNIEISYNSTNLNNPDNQYTFNVIPKNEEKENRTLIINNMNNNQIRYQINFCKSPHSISMYYQSSESMEEKRLNFSSENTIIEQKIKKNAFKLRFESEDDFVFSYSFIDSADKSANEKWINEREEFNDLIIKNIDVNNIIDKTSNIITITFNPNYKASSTRYIIVIVPKNEKNTYENLSNPCYITKLVTEKNENIVIVDIADTGENGLINVDADISELLDINEIFIANIISQELRFEKKVKYYTPFIFSSNQEEEKEEKEEEQKEEEEEKEEEEGKEKELELNKEKSFELYEEKIYFNLKYMKKSQINEMFLLNYKIEQQTPIKVYIIDPNNKEESFNINNLEGYLNFLCDKSGNYSIIFEKNLENNLINLISTESVIRGTFRILSSEYPFNLDVTKDHIEFNEFNITGTEAPSLTMNIEPLKKDYTKKISIENIDFDEINKIVSVKKNTQENKSLNFPYYTFEKGLNYTIIINFNKKEENKFTLEKMKIDDFSLYNIQELKKGNIKYNDTIDKFLIVNWATYENISIITKKNGTRFFISELNEKQTKNLVKEFQNLNFTLLTNLNIRKPINTNFSVLMIILNEKGTEINFEVYESHQDNKKNDPDSKGTPKILIIILPIVGVILIIILIVIVLKCRKKNNSIDFERQTKNLEGEKLMEDI